ncbi:MAG: hypothetical protein ACYDG2_03830 [Ruminiclostridium sp.]
MIAHILTKEEKTVLNVTFQSSSDMNYRKEILSRILLKPQNNLFSIYIMGLPAGILEIFEKIETQTKFTSNIKKGLILKSLPELYAITDFSKDIDIVIEYIDFFNEGSIIFYILNNSFEKTDVTKQIKTSLKVREFIESDYTLKIEISDDAGCFCIDSPDKTIIQDIKKQLAEYM